MKPEHIGVKGWNSCFSVGSVCLVNAICPVCQKKVKHGSIGLEEHCFNINHRGNKTDYYQEYHRECTSDRKIWIEEDSKNAHNEEIYKKLDSIRNERKELKEKMKKLRSNIKS